MPVSSEKRFHKKVFVTVGTTEFNELIETIAQKKVLEILVRLGYSKLVIQIGRGRSDAVESLDKLVNFPLEIFWYRFKKNIKEDISTADLVISHGGAGTCLETLELKRPLVVILNDSLQDSHQIELARQLERDGHLVYCDPIDLAETLIQSKYNRLKPLPPGQPKLFARWLDNFLGF